MRDGENIRATFTSATANVTFYYRIGGSDSDPDPDNLGEGSTDTKLYNPLNKPIVTNGQTIKVIGTRADYQNSAIATNTVATLAAPTIGYSKVNETRGTCTITPPAGEGVTVRYTTDGSTPTSASTAYSAPFTVANFQTVKAVAFKTGLVESAPTTQKYYPTIATPVIGFRRDGSNIVPVITTATTGTTVQFYGTTGNSSAPADPTTESYDWCALGYGCSLPSNLSAGNFIKVIGVDAYFIAHEDHWLPSEVVTAEVPSEEVETPTITLSEDGTSVTNITCGTTDATIRYAINGSVSENSPIYTSGTIANLNGKTFNAQAFKPNMIASEVATKEHSATPIITVAAATGEVSISGTGVHYTSGDNPANPVYNSSAWDPEHPITLSDGETIKAVSYESGKIISAVASETYEAPVGPLTVATPSITWHNDCDEEGWYFTISCDTPGATIWYTYADEGNEAANPVTEYLDNYEDPVYMYSERGIVTVRAYAEKDGYTSSSEATPQSQNVDEDPCE